MRHVMNDIEHRHKNYMVEVLLVGSSLPNHLQNYLFENKIIKREDFGIQLGEKNTYYDFKKQCCDDTC